MVKKLKNMNKRIFYFVAVGVLPFLSACDNEDKIQEISKDGAIETTMSVEHLGDKLDFPLQNRSLTMNPQRSSVRRGEGMNLPVI